MPGPGPSAHQVLVYSGPGVSPLSLSHTTLTLSLLLLPHYTVQPVTPETLSSEPWEPACALLVIPGGRDLPFVEELTMKSGVTKRIGNYVKSGGRYLGICAGAYFGAEEVRFDVGGGKEVVGKRDLAFFPGACVGPAFPGFDYTSENGSRAVSLSINNSSNLIEYLYYNGGGYFQLPSTPLPSTIRIIAEYTEPSSPTSSVAAVLCKKGTGSALLCSVHFEYPLHDPPAKDAIAKLNEGERPDEDIVDKADKARLEWAGQLLQMLGLRLPKDENGLVGHSATGGDGADEDPHLLLHPTHPSPIFIFSHPSLSIAQAAFDNLSGKLIFEGEGWRSLRDGNDKLLITTVSNLGSTHEVSSYLSVLRRTFPDLPPSLSTLSVEDDPTTINPPQPPDFHSVPKKIFLPSTTKDTSYSPQWTPLFNFESYWSEIDAARKRAGRKSGVMRKDEVLGERPALGDMIWYGETVTSTQTMLDRNPLLLASLPSPLAFLASFQLTGRGRGSNIWLSPPGCLQFSLLLTLPKSMSSKMTFIQYLMALAVCEAVDDDGRLGVRIKWPNDIYAEVEGVGGTEVGGGVKGRAKLGGILVNTNYIEGRWRIVIGCGINILNALPTTSLSHLHSLLTTRVTKSTSCLSNSTPLPPAPTMEGTFAKIMESFERKWEQFLEDKGFAGFLDEYHSRWLHGNQEVTLTTVEPNIQLRIQSITPDHGLLRCLPIQSSTKSNTSTKILHPFQREEDDGGEDRTSTFSLRPSASATVSKKMTSSESEYVDLQPDGNSFDMMSGLIKRKV